ncbi:MAG: DUF2148 domain-containing protein [Clostridia bacterium]|nr:DUF2148 domain-containing protein [Clostridia bacterium]
MFYKSEELEMNSAVRTAERMCAAARTAPKGRGIDNIETAVLTGEDKDELARHMEKVADREDVDFFARDAKNIRDAQAIVLIGTKYKTRGVQYCGLCGYKDCAENAKNGGICSFDVTDLGIAIGSAVSIAADDRADNRVMFSAGKTAAQLKLLGEDVKLIYGIPIAVRGKNLFFDRKKK